MRGEVRYLIAGLICLIIGVGALLCLFGCSKEKKIDPIRQTYGTTEKAKEACFARLGEGQSVLYPVSGTSMEPLISTGDCLIVQKIGFAQVIDGKVYAYRPISDVVAHRTVFHDAYGFLLSGDNASVSDSRVRLTAENLIGEIVFIAHVGV